MINQLIWMVPILPVLSGIWIALSYMMGNNRGEKGEKLTASLASSGIITSIIILLIIDINALFNGAPGEIVIGEWLHSGNYQVLFNFYLDSFALSFLTLIAFVCFIGIRFSINYLHREQGFQRFFMILCLFSGAMLLIVSAGNMLLTFVGWELAGISSYLLIAYTFERKNAVDNATQVIITNRIGDAGFIMAIICSFWLLGDINWVSIQNTQIQDMPINSLNSGIVLSCFLLAALVKSAQFPFSPWIYKALEGPTPSSALFYGSLMVHSGVYLLIRLQPLLEQNSTILTIVLILGTLSVVYGFFCSLVQTDIKSALIFSTITHTGLMFCFIGLSWFSLAAWYLILHAMWRAFQFLHAPSLMHMAEKKVVPVHPWISSKSWLFTFSVQRFWLDHFNQWAIMSPVKTLAHDADRFDENYISHFMGNSNIEFTHDNDEVISNSKVDDSQEALEKQTGIGYAVGIPLKGIIGHSFEKLAYYVYWVEEHMILKSSGEGLLHSIQSIGKNLVNIEELLNKPRYLMILVSITFVIII